ncbi:hypothetical protein GDI3130 [Gluconacetobacter diazotrophicus PA1 5]|uniref:Uncharacterized protein n=1 Tax=Gluconacetobacter diazotrophicus (strain ATCC 49037 / DSM 5601 / CCUG 37298 / CIP 103539 / LMG 7603 / PAl5) TaxID=272568 RepID=A9HSF9_GLUDA|nr:hypothetical protein GDI3130 [Gluconacetobacter diazotrophicus PA1 5]
MDGKYSQCCHLDLSGRNAAERYGAVMHSVDETPPLVVNAGSVCIIVSDGRGGCHPDLT